MKDLIGLLLQHDLPIVFLVTLAARVGLPLPAAPLLVVAGGLVVTGGFPGLAAFGVSVLANVAGDALWFWGGRHYGHRVMRVLCRISLSPDSCVRQSEALINRWGGSSLIAAKFVPGISVVAAPMAGALGMAWPRFLGFDALASAIWTGAYMGLGLVFSTQVQQVLDLLAGTGAVALAALGVVLLVAAALRYARRVRVRRSLAMPRTSVVELQASLRSTHPPLVIDVRGPASTQVDPRHIPAAVSAHLSEIDALATTLPRGRDIVVYCNCPNEESAARAALALRRKGLTRVWPLAGGLDAWVAAGGATGTYPSIPP